MNLQQFVGHRLEQKNFIHDFSLGALFTYHKLAKLVEEDKVVMTADSIVLNTNKAWSLILYSGSMDQSIFDSTTIGDKKLRISSATPLPIATKKKKKEEEVFYQIDAIELHSGKKKYHSLLKPIAIFEKRPDLGITLVDIQETDSAQSLALRDLHNEWVKYKLSLPKVHRISFPTARYRNTLDPMPVPTYKKAIYIKGKLYGFIVFSLEGEVAFELSFCTLYWKDEFKILSGLNQYIFSYCVIQLSKQGIKFVNSGFGLNKNLKVFKQSAQKSNSVYRYTYEV